MRRNDTGSSRHRRRSRPRVVRSFGWFTGMVYSIYLGYLLFAGYHRTRSTGGYYNLRPFHTIGQYMLHGEQFSHETIAVNLLGNIVAFVPFGCLLPALLSWCRKPARTAAVMFAALLCIETTQLVLKVGMFDVDDLILNEAGVLLGYWLYAEAERWRYQPAASTRGGRADR